MTPVTPVRNDKDIMYVFIFSENYLLLVFTYMNWQLDITLVALP